MTCSNHCVRVRYAPTQWRQVQLPPLLKSACRLAAKLNPLLMAGREKIFPWVVLEFWHPICPTHFCITWEAKWLLLHPDSSCQSSSSVCHIQSVRICLSPSQLIVTAHEPGGENDVHSVSGQSTSTTKRTTSTRFASSSDKNAANNDATGSETLRRKQMINILSPSCISCLRSHST